MTKTKQTKDKRIDFLKEYDKANKEVEETMTKTKQTIDLKIDKTAIMLICVMGVAVICLFGGLAIGNQKGIETGKNLTLNNQTIIEQWKLIGQNETLSNQTLMSEVGNQYILAVANNNNMTVYANYIGQDNKSYVAKFVYNGSVKLK